MRTTLNLDDALMLRLKRKAAETNQTLTQLIERAIQEQLERDEAAARRPFRLNLPVVSGRVRSGVDLRDRDSLMDLMDSRD